MTVAREFGARGATCWFWGLVLWSFAVRDLSRTGTWTLATQFPSARPKKRTLHTLAWPTRTLRKTSPARCGVVGGEHGAFGGARWQTGGGDDDDDDDDGGGGGGDDDDDALLLRMLVEERKY